MQPPSFSGLTRLLSRGIVVVGDVSNITSLLSSVGNIPSWLQSSSTTNVRVKMMPAGPTCTLFRLGSLSPNELDRHGLDDALAAVCVHRPQ